MLAGRAVYILYRGYGIQLEVSSVLAGRAVYILYRGYGIQLEVSSVLAGRAGLWEKETKCKSPEDNLNHCR